MKALLINGLLLLIVNLSYGQSASAAEQALLNIETKRLEAVAARNHEFLANLYDETFHGIIASGHEVDKVKMLEFLESYNPYVIQSLENVKARVDGTIAVTTGKLVNKSKSGSIIGQTRFMHVYQKKGDQWKMIESQGTLVIQE
jgi:hypothetical protein